MKITPVSKARHYWNQLVNYVKSLGYREVIVNVGNGRSHNFQAAQDGNVMLPVSTPLFRSPLARKAMKAFKADYGGDPLKEAILHLGNRSFERSSK